MLKSLGVFGISGPGLLLLSALTVPGAFADTTYDITVSNLGSGYTGPYVQVDVDLVSSTDATVTFTSLDNGTYAYLMGGNQGVGVNVNGTASITGTSTESNTFSGFSAATLTNSGSQMYDGEGTMSNSVSFGDGFDHTATTVTFTLTASGATTWSSSANVLTDAAAHVFACADTCKDSNGAANTGFAGTLSAPINTPEASTIEFLASDFGLIALAGAFFARRKRGVSGRS